MKSFKNKYFGGSIAFYRKVASIGIPGALQQLLQSACGIVDSLMVSWIGQVSSVGTASQIDMIYSTIAYGINVGTGMFASQFFGANNIANVKKCFGLKIILILLNACFWVSLSLLFGEQILRFYLNDDSVVTSGLQYLNIACISFFPAGINYAFAHMYRSIHKAKVPFLVSCMTMAINLSLNALLIFGLFGFPQLGVVGAAYGTLVAQSVTCIFNIIYAYTTKAIFIGSAAELFSIDFAFAKPILQKTFPLVCNELLFAFGNTLFVKAFGILGKDSMDAYYVGNQISQVFYFVVWGLSDATTVVLATTLGKSQREQAIKEGNYFIGIGFVLSIMLTTLIIGLANPLVALFQLSKESVVQSARWILKAFAVKIALRLFNTLIFASMRAGGATKVLLYLDSGITWLIGIPAAFILVYWFKMDEIALVFLFVQIEALVRVIIGMRLFNNGSWANNLTKLMN